MLTLRQKIGKPIVIVLCRLLAIAVKTFDWSLELNCGVMPPEKYAEMEKIREDIIKNLKDFTQDNLKKPNAKA